MISTFKVDRHYKLDVGAPVLNSFGFRLRLFIVYGEVFIKVHPIGVETGFLKTYCLVMSVFPNLLKILKKYFTRKLLKNLSYLVANFIFCINWGKFDNGV